MNTCLTEYHKNVQILIIIYYFNSYKSLLLGSLQKFSTANVLKKAYKCSIIGFMSMSQNIEEIGNILVPKFLICNNVKRIKKKWLYFFQFPVHILK